MRVIVSWKLFNRQLFTKLFAKIILNGVLWVCVSITAYNMHNSTWKTSLHKTILYGTSPKSTAYACGFSFIYFPSPIVLVYHHECKMFIRINYDVLEILRFIQKPLLHSFYLWSKYRQSQIIPQRNQRSSFTMQ